MNPLPVPACLLCTATVFGLVAVAIVFSFVADAEVESRLTGIPSRTPAVLALVGVVLAALAAVIGAEAAAISFAVGAAATPLCGLLLRLPRLRRWQDARLRRRLLSHGMPIPPSLRPARR